MPRSTYRLRMLQDEYGSGCLELRWNCWRASNRNYIRQSRASATSSQVASFGGGKLVKVQTEMSLSLEAQVTEEDTSTWPAWRGGASLIFCCWFFCLLRRWSYGWFRPVSNHCLIGDDAKRSCGSVRFSLHTTEQGGLCFRWFPHCPHHPPPHPTTSPPAPLQTAGTRSNMYNWQPRSWTGVVDVSSSVHNEAVTSLFLFISPFFADLFRFCFHQRKNSTGIYHGFVIGCSTTDVNGILNVTSVCWRRKSLQNLHCWFGH